MKRRPFPLLPLLMALPFALAAGAAVLWGIPAVRDWLLAAVKVAVIP